MSVEVRCPRCGSDERLWASVDMRWDPAKQAWRAEGFTEGEGVFVCSACEREDYLPANWPDPVKQIQDADNIEILVAKAAGLSDLITGMAEMVRYCRPVMGKSRVKADKLLDQAALFISPPNEGNADDRR